MPGAGGAALEITAKEGAEAAAAAAGEAAAKAAGEAAAKATGEAAAKAAAESAAKDAAKLAAKNAAKYAAAAAAAAGAGYLYMDSSKVADTSNKTPRGITKLESADGKSKRVLNVYFTPAIPILKSDIITISGSKTTPSIDGPQTVKSVVSDGEIVIDFGKDITTMTEGGSIKVQTTTSAHAKDTVEGAAKDVGGTVGGGLSGLGSGLFGGLFGDMGFDPMWLVWGCGGLVVLMILFFILKNIVKF
jgi:hypothetical protein